MTEGKHVPFQDFEKEILHRFENIKPEDHKGPCYTIIMPPPNVTGSLHVGHALSSTLQDILIRWKRMQGFQALWLPGTDHAGIATQMMVEKSLAEKGLFRKDMTREQFLEHVWAWKNEYGDVIVSQMKAMGFSADWSRFCFTLDENVSKAVRKAFVQLYEEGLIYKDCRLIHFDPVLETAVSDLEVLNQEQKDPMWTISYALEKGGEICIATTRPETLFADVAIAVHPEDMRYQHLIGQMAIIPIIERKIPIIADEAVLKEKGTGAVKITPAHDFLDFEIAKRHVLPLIHLLDTKGALNEQAPKNFQGLDRFKARLKVIEALGPSVVKEEMIVHHVPCSQRSGAVLEPRLTDQWFMDTKPLAEKALQAVQKGETQFVPKEWENNYFEWLDNIHPWCLSRQLWWGHQIPAWYDQDGDIFVAHSYEEALLKAREKKGLDVVLTQDQDVLDTWFSSALWPFSTLGWPEQTKDMQDYYPTTVLVTGFDIIFFWVARMMMMGLWLTGKVPFEIVYIHPLLRDEKGQKMSKTKGNVINPLSLTKEYGADALRLGLALIATQTQYASFGIKHVEYARNFTTKLWNVVRFILMTKACQDLQQALPLENSPHLIFNQWILSKAQEMNKEVTKALKEYRFHEASHLAVHFTWKVFCDWYIELIKDLLYHASLSEECVNEIKQTLKEVLHILLKTLHPFIPFVTEKLWSMLGFDTKGFLVTSTWPACSFSFEDSMHLHEHMQLLIEVITQIRRIKGEFQLQGHLLELFYQGLDKDQEDFLLKHEGSLKRLAGLSAFCKIEKEIPKECALFTVQKASFGVSILKFVDVEKEKERLQKNIDKKMQEREKIEKRLQQKDFSEKAPVEIVQELQERVCEIDFELQNLKASLSIFSSSTSIKG